MPSSFIGGPRDMRRRYMDAMALVRSFGKPDIFLTMTCNPKWDEITHELYPGQTPQDRPDLIDWVFRAKLEELKDKLLKKDILGKVRAHVYVVEFQKRGLLAHEIDPRNNTITIVLSRRRATSFQDKLAKGFLAFVEESRPFSSAKRQRSPTLMEVRVRHILLS
jgi:hypothetical protein